jgi:hypothetical protein
MSVTLCSGFAQRGLLSRIYLRSKILRASLSFLPLRSNPPVYEGLAYYIVFLLLIDFRLTLDTLI